MPSQPQPLFHVRANYDFAGADRGELGFHAGDVLGVVDADYDDWWEAELRGVRGMIPAAYVSRLGG
ncbi:SH3 domain-containing protein, partial [Blastocladiella britannica]